MATYYVDSVGGSNTSPYDTWAKAATSAYSPGSGTLADGDIMYVASRHVEADVASSKTMVGPGSIGNRARIISVTQGTTTYASGAQIKTTGGAYNLTLNGNFDVYGVTFQAGQHILLTSTDTKVLLLDSCTLKVAHNCQIQGNQGTGPLTLLNCTVDVSADTSASSTSIFQSRAMALTVRNLTLVQNGSYKRTGVLFYSEQIGSTFDISSCDFSGLDSNCEVFSSLWFSGSMTNCKTAATWTAFSAAISRACPLMILSNVGNADDPTYLFSRDYAGTTESSTTVYRSSGGTIETVATSWLVTTSSYCNEGQPHCTPWIYGTISATGSKTFSIYIENTTADFTDAEVWMEVEYFGASDSALWTYARDKRADISATAVAQTDDSSTWVSEDLTYKQVLSVTGTVNEDGQYRARVCVGLGSIASSRKFYVDPKVTVS